MLEQTSAEEEARRKSLACHRPGIQHIARAAADDNVMLAYLEELVQASRVVSTKDAHDDKKQQHGSHEASPVGRRQEAQHGKDHGDDRHANELHARADIYGQQGGVGGGPEHITMHLQTAGRGWWGAETHHHAPANSVTSHVTPRFCWQMLLLCQHCCSSELFVNSTLPDAVDVSSYVLTDVVSEQQATLAHLGARKGAVALYVCCKTAMHIVDTIGVDDNSVRPLMWNARMKETWHMPTKRIVACMPQAVNKQHSAIATY